jgi:formylglycine-generating enzyme required for sulfatase activity
MTTVPANSSWLFVISGTEIEPFAPNCITDACETVDVQYPWEAMAVRYHTPVHINFSAPFSIDTYPVTNAQYSAFLADSAYWPVADDHRFLADWSCACSGVAAGSAAISVGGPACTFPAGWDNKPVTHVAVEDALAYCAHYGKRLPNDWEWQYAAQGSDDRQYPWGNDADESRIPPPVTGRTLNPDGPADVMAHPTGASPFGVQDLIGNVWQMTNTVTDAHSRSLLLRGGSYYHPQGSEWYFPNGAADGSAPLPLTSHNKWLMVNPGYDRAGTVGFRCVADTV